MTIENGLYFYDLIKTFLYLLLLFSFPFFTLAQTPTVGLIEYTDQVSDGYTLFTPLSSESTFLIDNCGNKINEWDGLQPSNSNLAMLSRDGLLYRSSFNTFYKISWDNEVLWSYSVSNLDLLRHHDFHVMPNGNILFIASQIFSFSDLVEKGRNPSTLGNGGGQNGFKVDGIYEIKPIGEDDAELVWSWNFYDHLVQDFDQEKENFDEIINQPRRLDVNFTGETGNSFDWLHCNGIDYHEELDQIIVSSRASCELYVIDHSTTTEEAASTEGGIYGHGGDFLWRWGNPQAYENGTSEDQKLWEQHDPKWVTNGYPNEGKISVFNNLYNFEFNGVQPFSTVHFLDSEAVDGIYPINTDNEFSPADFEFTYTGEVVGNNFWSNIMSNVQAMSNGNLFVSQGTTGELFEINQEKEIVWVYQNPVREFIYDQGSNPLSLESAVDIFISTKYESDFEGFDNYDMTPLGILENENEVSVLCDSIVTNIFTPIDEFVIYPNPVDDLLTIQTSLPDYDLRLVDLFGKTVLSQKATLDATIQLGEIHSGVYFLLFEAVGREILSRKVIVR